MTRVAALLLAFGAAACGGSTEPVPAPGGTDIILELGQTARLGATDITVALTSVDDSRCSPDVSCIWEGNARIAVDLRYAGGPKTTGELNTHPTYPRALSFRFVQIALTDLEPLPLSTQHAVVYRAHLRWNYMLD